MVTEKYTLLMKFIRSNWPWWAQTRDEASKAWHELYDLRREVIGLKAKAANLERELEELTTVNGVMDANLIAQQRKIQELMEENEKLKRYECNRSEDVRLALEYVKQIKELLT